LILKIWQFKAQQSILLRKGMDYYTFLKKKRVFWAIFEYARRKLGFADKVEKFANFRKKVALNKFIRMTKMVAITDQKLLVAECFNN
jgi:hypothetical protein